MNLRVLFINLPSIPFDTLLKMFSGESQIANRLEMPLGILYLSSYLKKYNHNCKVGLLDYSIYVDEISVYRDIEDFIESIARKVVDFVPDVLAFSLLFSTSHRFFSESVDILKSAWPQAVTIVGGNHATNAVTTLLKMKNVDYVAMGQAEKAFTTFIEQLSDSKPINVRGIYSKKDMGLTLPRQVYDYVTDLDTIPFPDWELLNLDVYLGSKGRKRNIGDSNQVKCATIMTSRGCPFRCTFCAAHTVHGRKMMYRSIDNVLEEVKLLYDLYDVTLFIIEDDLFTVNKSRAVSLLSALKNLNIPNFEIQFPNALSVNTLNEEVLEALIGAGMNIACLAIESGSEFVQRNVIKKNCNLKKAKEIVLKLKSKGVLVRCYYIFGFPGETKEQMKETIDYAKSLEADWSAFNIATPLVGSEMYKQFVQSGYLQDDPNMWSNSSYWERQFDTKEITAIELNDFVYRANLDVNFINNPNIINGNYNKAIEIFNDILTHYPFHIFGWYCLMQCYKGLGNMEMVKQLTGKIERLINSDKRSADMFYKYGGLMPELERNTVLSK